MKKREEIAEETLDIFVSIAQKLGFKLIEKELTILVRTVLGR